MCRYRLRRDGSVRGWPWFHRDSERNRCLAQWSGQSHVSTRHCAGPFWPLPRTGHGHGATLERVVQYSNGNFRRVARQCHFDLAKLHASRQWDVSIGIATARIGLASSVHFGRQYHGRARRRALSLGIVGVGDQWGGTTRWAAPLYTCSHGSTGALYSSLEKKHNALALIGSGAEWQGYFARARERFFRLPVHVPQIIEHARICVGSVA
jgi:hypothetical protein